MLASAPQLRLARASQLWQIRNAGAVAGAVAELGSRLKMGRISGDEFLMGTVGFAQLGHIKAAEAMGQFITSWRESSGVDAGVPVLDGFDVGHATGRAVGMLQDLSRLDRGRADYDAAFDQVVGHGASRINRDVLNAGRHTMEWSTLRAGTRWRRVTDGNPCAFCAMLATREDYRSAESAMYVVGHTHTTKAGAVYTGRRRGTQKLGHKFHDHCGCTVVEVLGDPVEFPGDDAHRDLYHAARAACEEEGIPPTAKNVLAKMRETAGQMDDPPIHDGHIPVDRQGKPGPRPKSREEAPKIATGGAGGGWKPPQQMGMAGPDSPDDDFGPIGPRGWEPPARRSQIFLDEETVEKVLAKHGRDLVPGEGPAGVWRWMQDIIDHPGDAAPEGRNFLLYGTSGGSSGVVVIAQSSKNSWFVITAYEQALVDWQSWVERRSH